MSDNKCHLRQLKGVVLFFHDLCKMNGVQPHVQQLNLNTVVGHVTIENPSFQEDWPLGAMKSCMEAL